MKKLTVILLVAAMVIIPSCKNQNNKKAQKEAEKTEISEKEQLITEELKVNLQNLTESAKRLKKIAFIQKRTDGSFTLTDKEKMVKPEYLLDPALANNLVTLSQKYRAWQMFNVDKVVCDMYDMPVADYDAALQKISIDLNDPALNEFKDADWNDNEALKASLDKFIDAEYESGRAAFMWDSVAASLVEQLFVITQNMDKFLTLFDDQAAADITFNFVCVHEGIMSLIEFYPEMEGLNNALMPLYVINAISVDQLRDQLTELKGEIEVVRAYLLK